MMKFKKYIWLILCSTVLLVGCGITADQIQDAIGMCEQNGGLNSIIVNGIGPGVDTIYCKNGAYFDVDN